MQAQKSKGELPSTTFIAKPDGPKMKTLDNFFAPTDNNNIKIVPTSVPSRKQSKKKKKMAIESSD